MRVPFQAGYVVCHCPLSCEVVVEAELLLLLLLVTKVDGVGTWPVA
jgi:hypothetical protein